MHYPEVIAFVFTLGAIFGSFFNVCIHRLPREESLLSPSSRCPVCRKPIQWYNNIPIISYFVLRGKCADCKSGYSPRYMVIELVTALAFTLIWFMHGLSVLTPITILFFSLLLIATVVDLEHQIIPDEISVGGLFAGLAISTLYPSLHGVEIWHQGLMLSVLGLLMGGGIIYVTGILGSLVFRKDAMGGGDVKLLAMLGTFLGWKGALLVFFMAPILALPIGLFVKLTKRGEVIAFGPFLSLAGWITFIWGAQLIDWYLTTFTL